MAEIFTLKGLKALIFPAKPAQMGLGWLCLASGARISRMGVVLSFLYSSPIAAEQLLGEEAASIPIFDVHVHYNAPAWQAFPPETVITLFDRNRVTLAG